jgi:hypothetical protein
MFTSENGKHGEGLKDYLLTERLLVQTADISSSGGSLCGGWCILLLLLLVILLVILLLLER